MAKRVGRVGVVVVAMVGWLLATVAPAAAGSRIDVFPQFPGTVTVGQANVPASITVSNFSTPPDLEDFALNVVTLVPSCGVDASFNCPVVSVDPTAFEVTQAIGGAGRCAGVPFSISHNIVQGEVLFIPAASVTLPLGENCRLDLRFTVHKRPRIDADPAQPQVQTNQIAGATATSTTTNGQVVGTDSSTMTVNRAVATLATSASPQSAAVGQSIADTATVTGVPNGPAPTGGVRFTVFADQPGAGLCSGPSQDLGLVALAAGGGNPPSSTATSAPVTVTGAGTYRFVAGYIGDDNYGSLPTSPCGAPGENVTVAPPGRYTPLTPARILDTRTGIGGVVPVGPAGTVTVQVSGQGGVPAEGATAVAMNVTVTQPTGDGFLTIWPSGSSRPLAANLNFTPGKTVPNLVIVKLGAGGTVDMFNSAGSTHVVYDVAGWFSDDPTGNDGRFQPLVPARILDTRSGTGAPGVRLGPGASVDLQVTGRGQVPAAGVQAVVMNVAVTNTTAGSYLTVHPAGETRPLAANLNWVAGNTVSNRVVAKLGAGGTVTIYNNAGLTDVVVDVNGWFTDASQAGAAGAYVPMFPARILDTRTGAGGIPGPLGPGSTVDVQITGRGGLPASGVGAVVLNATVVSPAGPGYLTIFPAGTIRPLASDLNYAAGEIRPNLVVVKVGAGGKVSLFTPTGTHVVFDVAGYVPG